MQKYLKYLSIIIIILVKQSTSNKCFNNYCECNQLKDDLKCENKNKAIIDLILNELKNNSIIDIKSLDLSFNELNNINIEIKSIIKNQF